MTYGKTDYGWEYTFGVAYQDQTPVTTFDIGLYDDAADDIQSDGDLPQITTEPTGSTYSRQTVNASAITAAFQGGRWQVAFPDADFDVSDSSQTVRSGFIVVQFAADGDGSATDHLLGTFDLGETADLSARSGTYGIAEYGLYDSD